MNKIRTFSLFTGVAGLDSVFHEDDQFETIGFSEIDKHASAILKHNYPDVKNYGDLTKIDIDKMPDFDLLTFGFSCQPYSVAGKRLGLEDLRGQIIYDVFEIIKKKSPKYLLAENVKGLLSHNKGATFKLILTELSKLGYLIDFDLLNAKNFGVPQNRERIFIVGVKNEEKSINGSGEDEKGHIGESPGDIFNMLRNSEKPYDKYVEIKRCITERCAREILHTERKIGEDIKTKRIEQQGKEESVENMKFYGAIDSKRWNKESNKILSRNFSQGERIYSEEGISPQLSASMGGTANGSALVATEEKFIATRFLGRNGKLTSKDCPTIQTCDLPHIKEPKIEKVYDRSDTGKKSQAATVYSEDGIFACVSSGTHGYAMGQISVKSEILAWSSSGRGKGEREERISKKHANTLNTGEGCRSQSTMNYANSETRIRRLTPTECERLMGWKDNVTKYGNYDGEVKEVSDTQRYKCCGNGVVSKCVFQIKNLIKKLHN